MIDNAISRYYWPSERTQRPLRPNSTSLVNLTQIGFWAWPQRLLGLQVWLIGQMKGYMHGQFWPMRDFCQNEAYKHNQHIFELSDCLTIAVFLRPIWRSEAVLCNCKLKYIILLWSNPTLVNQLPLIHWKVQKTQKKDSPQHPCISSRRQVKCA